jgi:hypothetical protein
VWIYSEGALSWLVMQPTQYLSSACCLPTEYFYKINFSCINKKILLNAEN